MSNTPLPRSWLHHIPEDEGGWSDIGAKRARDLVAFGRLPGVGTKARLRLQLMNRGWSDIDAIDNVLATESKAFNVMAHLADIEAMNLEILAKPEDAITAFKDDMGLKAVTTRIKPGARLGSLWRSLTLTPTWLAVRSVVGHRNIILVGKSASMLEHASASFVRDLWKPLGGTPESRMPLFRRTALEAWKSPGALERLEDTVDPANDFLVVHGGNHWKLDDSANAFSTLSSMRSSFDGMILYEMLVDTDKDFSDAIMMARRRGFGPGTTHFFGIAGETPKTAAAKRVSAPMKKKSPSKPKKKKKKATKEEREAYLKGKIPALRKGKK